MARLDTHEAVKLLQSAGLDEEKAEAIVRVVGVGQDALATKVDLEALTQTTKADLGALSERTKADLEALSKKTKADLDAGLRELELRLRHDLTLRLGAMVFAAAGVQVAIVGFLLAEFLT